MFFISCFPCYWPSSIMKEYSAAVTKSNTNYNRPNENKQGQYFLELLFGAAVKQHKATYREPMIFLLRWWPYVSIINCPYLYQYITTQKLTYIHVHIYLCLCEEAFHLFGSSKYSFYVFVYESLGCWNIFWYKCYCNSIFHLVIYTIFRENPSKNKIFCEWLKCEKHHFFYWSHCSKLSIL